MQVSVIMPIHNGAQFLPKSLIALVEARDEQTEIIIVDDASTDDTAEFALKFADKVLCLEKQSGCAEARNFGAKQACGEILFFVDADVVVQKDAIEQLREIFRSNGEYAAMFGSYDDAPSEVGFFSQYRNLIHHYFHQISPREAETFWSGCGAIKRNIFLEAGGYDERLYQRPAIEDIDFGYQLREKGHRILLDRNFQAKHLKKWTFHNILRTDIFDRALPWSRLLLQNPQRKHTLNVNNIQKICAVFVWLMILSCIVGVFYQLAFVISAIFLALVIGLNWRLYHFLGRKKGVWFALRAIPMQILYYIYSSSVFAFCWFEFYFLPARKRKS